MSAINQQGLAMAITVLVGLGSSGLGAIGTFGESRFKKMNQMKHPTIRSAGLLFTKFLQSATAALTLLIIGSLFTNPTGLTALALFSFGMAITPLVNRIAQLIKNDAANKIFDICDRVVSIASKIINTAAVSTGIGLSLGKPAGIFGCVLLSALSYAAY